MRYWACIIAITAITLTSCSASVTPTATPIPPTPTLSPTATLEQPTATPAPTPIPQRLVVCATEPEAANPFAPSQSGDDLLALFYELPAERVGYQWEPRLIDHIPSLEAGDVITQLMPVPQGTRYVDISGALQIHQGETALQLPQLIVTFTLKSNLVWSNGVPLTSEDIVLGYHLAQSSETQGRWRALVERTARFIALDERQLQWTGVPGYLSADYPGFLFPPQPAHRWQGKTLTEILGDRTPPATGPFQIVAWEAGHEVRLERNPNYAGSPPTLETIIFRFPQIEASAWSELLLADECDILLPDPVATTDWREWATLSEQNAATIWADPAPVVLRLDFNIAPQGEGPSPVADLQTRLGLAHCIDRARLSEALPGEALLPANSFIPPGHPAFDVEWVWRIPYNLEIGQSTLDEIGWRDEDGDGIREAYDIAGFKDGQPLSLTLHLAPQYFVAAAYIAADLETCGVGILPYPTEPQLLYAADPVSPLFGRSFQLALFGWSAELPQVCGAWLSDRVPDKSNAWVGENFSGYTSEIYDGACQQALTALDSEGQWAALQKAQSALMADLPSLFLTWRPFWFVARPEVQGLQPDTSTEGTLWNAENIFIGEMK